MRKIRFGSMGSLLVLGAMAGAVGCGDDDDDNNVRDAGEEDARTQSDAGTDGGNDETASLRVLHLSPDAPAVDVIVNDDENTRPVTNLEFPDGTEFAELTAGEYDFDVVPTGGALADSVLEIDDLVLESGKYYTAVAYGPAESIAALALVDDPEGLAAGNIRVRAIHAADGVGEVDIWNIPAKGDPTPLYTDLEYGEAGDALDVPAGTYTLGIDINNDETPDATFELPALSAGAVVNLYAVAIGAGAALVAQPWTGETTTINPVE